jgi:glutaredoxin
MQVAVYTKEGCHLCENAIASLKKIQERDSFELSIEDITEDSRLFERFKDLIPVVEIDGEIRLAGVALSNPNVLIPFCEGRCPRLDSLIDVMDSKFFQKGILP